MNYQTANRQLIIHPISQTKEQIEDELQSFKNANSDWLTDVVKGQIVASYNNRLATFTGIFFSIFIS